MLPAVDTDEDGWADCANSCPAIPNTDQANGEGDGDAHGEAYDTYGLDPANDLEGGHSLE